MINNKVKIIVLLLFLYGISFLQAQNKTAHIYKTIGNDTLKLDVYKPENLKRKDRLPVVIWIHGGGFSGGARDGEDEVRLMEYLVDNNYVAVSVSYRLLRKGKETGFGCDCTKMEKMETFKQAVIDYLDASKFVIKHFRKLNIDKDRIIAGGSSAGAEVILNALYMKPFFLDNFRRYDRVKFAGAFSLAGAMVNAEYITELNAVPIVMFHGTEDNLVPYSSAPHHFCKPEDPGYLILDGSETIANRIRSLDKSFYLNRIVDGGHEVSAIPFSKLDEILTFIENSWNSDEIVQTTRIVKNKSN